jgi:hypothetical protein
MDNLQQEKRKISRHISHIQNIEDRYEQSANRAVQYLVFIKTSRIHQIKDTRAQLLCAITGMGMSAGKRQVGIDECVKLMFTPVQHASVCVKGVRGAMHISCLTPDQVWVSDFYDNIILTDSAGVTMHHVTGIPWFAAGRQAIDCHGELIYIDSDYNISKLSSDNASVSTLLNRPSPWIPCCVYSSTVTEDLIVGMWDSSTKTAKVTLFTKQLHHSVTIQYDDTGRSLYQYPHYISENMNGDIIVSDSYLCAVVVTDRGGKHRFSYKGSRLLPIRPRGICTDSFSHILVCDGNHNTVHMIDKDGHYLTLLLTQENGIDDPLGLSYDNTTHLLWVGSSNNTVCVYRYQQRRYSLIGKYLCMLSFTFIVYYLRHA